MCPEKKGRREKKELINVGKISTHKILPVTGAQCYYVCSYSDSGSSK